MLKYTIQNNYLRLDFTLGALPLGILFLKYVLSNLTVPNMMLKYEFLNNYLRLDFTLGALLLFKYVLSNLTQPNMILKYIFLNDYLRLDLTLGALPSGIIFKTGFSTSSTFSKQKLHYYSVYIHTIV